METISIVHPDSGDFITSKQNLDKITGANISVKLTTEFMESVDKNKDFIQQFPINAGANMIIGDFNYNELYSAQNSLNPLWFKKVKAKELWNSLVHCAWNTAEPGIMFEDNHHDYSPDGVYPQYRGVTTNPCGEIFMQPYDSCRLIHINLASFVSNPYTDSAQFETDKLYEVAYKTMRLADDLIDLEVEAIDRIIDHISRAEEPDILELDLWIKIQETAKKGRRAGVGFTGLADVFAMLGIRYGSEESLEYTDLILYTKMMGELDSTIDLAIIRGTFDGYDAELEKVL